MALTATSSTVTTAGGYGFCAIPAGGLAVVGVVVQFSADAARMSTPPLNAAANTAGKLQQLSDTPLPHVLGVDPTARAYAPNGVIQFGPGLSGTAPDGTYNIVIWTGP